MSPGEDRPIEEKQAPKEDAPLTQEQYDAQMQQLAERARAAGLNPLQALAHTYVRQGAATVRQGVARLEDFLTSLENKEEKPRKKEK